MAETEARLKQGTCVISTKDQPSHRGKYDNNITSNIRTMVLLGLSVRCSHRIKFGGNGFSGFWFLAQKFHSGYIKFQYGLGSEPIRFGPDWSSTHDLLSSEVKMVKFGFRFCNQKQLNVTKLTENNSTV